MADAIHEARHALMALRLEVVQSIADDVQVRVENALAEARAAGRREGLLEVAREGRSRECIQDTSNPFRGGMAAAFLELAQWAERRAAEEADRG